jgi:hypothetical protein
MSGAGPWGKSVAGHGRRALTKVKGQGAGSRRGDGGQAASRFIPWGSKRLTMSAAVNTMALST